MNAVTTRVRDSLVNALIGMIGTIVLIFATGAWATKENVTAHAADVAALTRAITELNNGQQRILDALCDPQLKKPRACTSTVVSPSPLRP